MSPVSDREDGMSEAEELDSQLSHSRTRDGCLDMGASSRPLGPLLASSSSTTKPKTPLFGRIDSAEGPLFFKSNSSDDVVNSFSKMEFQTSRPSTAYIGKGTISMDERRARAKALAHVPLDQQVETQSHLHRLNPQTSRPSTVLFRSRQPSNNSDLTHGSNSDDAYSGIQSYVSDPLCLGSPPSSTYTRTFALLHDAFPPQTVQLTHHLADDEAYVRRLQRKEDEERFEKQRHTPLGELSLVPIETESDSTGPLTATFKRALSKNLVGRSSSRNGIKYFPSKSSKVKGAASLLSQSGRQNNLTMEIVKTVSVMVENTPVPQSTTNTTTSSSNLSTTDNTEVKLEIIPGMPLSGSDSYLETNLA